MKKKLMMIVLVQVGLLGALTPPPTPGENLWNLVARINEELDVEVDAENSFLEAVDSTVDGIDQNILGIASCCEQAGISLGGTASLTDVIGSEVEVATSVLEAIDLTIIESKVDAIAGAVEQSVQDEFATIWSSIDSVQSTVEVIESKVDDLDSAVETVALQLDDLATVGLVSVESRVDVADSLAESLASCCENINTVIFPRIESKVDSIDSEVDITISLTDIIGTTVPRIESKIDVVSVETSVVESATDVLDVKINLIESKIDLLSGGSGSSSPCDATPIKATDFSFGSYTISTSGSYCLADDVTGKITVSASDVTLNLNGHTLTAPLAEALVIPSGVSRVQVFNGRLQGVPAGPMMFGAGVATIEGSDIVLEDIQINGSNEPACYVGPSFTASNVIIKHCDLIGGVDSAGLKVGINTINLQVQNCIISSIGGGSPGEAAVFFEDAVAAATRVVLQDCQIHSDNAQGIQVLGGVTDLQILDSSITRCGVTGIVMGNVSGTVASRVVIQNCYIANSGLVSAASGISLNNMNNVAVRDCSMVKNGTNGIVLNGISNVYVGYCTVEGNAATGISCLGDGNTGTIEYNTCINNGSRGIRIQAGVTNYTVEHNDLINNATINLGFNATAPTYNTIVANKAHTTATTTTGSNYSSPITIPVLEWQRSTAALTVVSGGPAITAWHNWSSIA